MAPTIFALGVTGYVGGDVLHALLKAHPELALGITCLVRSQTRGQELKKYYPTLRIVYGTLDDSLVIEVEAAKADIVLNLASCDHVGAAKAIRQGIQRKGSGILIHTSGTDILLPPGKKAMSKGGSKTYDDWDGVKECLSLPVEHSHGPVEKVLRDLASPKVKVAIICPPTIWGVGRGTGNTRSHQIYNLACAILRRGAGLKLPSPLAENLFWPNIHIRDLAKLYISIIESAVLELEGKEGKATWNEGGYYFAETGRLYWQEVADWIAFEAVRQGFFQDSNPTEADEDDRKELFKVGVALWNLGVDCEAHRAHKLFGWTPTEEPLIAEIPEIVRTEANRLEEYYQARPQDRASNNRPYITY